MLGVDDRTLAFDHGANVRLGQPDALRELPLLQPTRGEEIPKHGAELIHSPKC